MKRKDNLFLSAIAVIHSVLKQVVSQDVDVLAVDVRGAEVLEAHGSLWTLCLIVGLEELW